MSRIRPFRALRYDARRVDLGRVIAPPYDVIPPEERGSLFDRDPHNAIRLELTRDVTEEAATDYSSIPRTVEEWRRSGVLIRDEEEGLYVLRQEFRAPDGTPHAREGFFALLGLEDYGRRIVRPHERTLAAPKADRLKLLRAAHANLSPVFLLYEDRDESVGAILSDAAAKPTAAASDDAGTAHRLARLTDPDRVEALRDFLADRPLVIADGHHRYETALNYRDERRASSPGAGGDAPWEWLLVYLANAFAEGSLLLPIHRLVLKGSLPTEAAWSARLPGWSSHSVPVPDADAIPDLLRAHLAPLSDRTAFAVDDASGALRIFQRPAGGGELSVRVLHREVIEGVFGLDEEAVEKGAIAYPKDARQTARDLRAGRGVVALYLNPLAPEDVFRVTAEGDVLPQKSTFFSPKLPTGLVFRVFE